MKISNQIYQIPYNNKSAYSKILFTEKQALTILITKIFIISINKLKIKISIYKHSS